MCRVQTFKVNAMLSGRGEPPAYYADMKPPIRLGGRDMAVARAHDGMRMAPERLLKATPGPVPRKGFFLSFLFVFARAAGAVSRERPVFGEPGRLATTSQP